MTDIDKYLAQTHRAEFIRSCGNRVRINETYKIDLVVIVEIDDYEQKEKHDIIFKKKYLVGLLIEVDGEPVCKSLEQTLCFFNELKLFNIKGSEKKFTKLDPSNKDNILFYNKFSISRAEAMTMIELKNMILQGISFYMIGSGHEFDFKSYTAKIEDKFFWR